MPHFEQLWARVLAAWMSMQSHIYMHRWMHDCGKEGAAMPLSSGSAVNVQ